MYWVCWNKLFQIFTTRTVNKYFHKSWWHLVLANFNQFAVICMFFCIRLPNFVHIGSPTAEIWRQIHFSKAATAKYYFRFPICWCHCLQKVQLYKQTKFCQDNSIGGWDIRTSDFEIETSTILEFYFRFWSRPVRRNMHVILYQATEFRPNRSTHCGNMTS